MGILNKLFGTKSEKVEQVIHFPSPATISSIHEMYKRAMVAWIAFRLGKLLTFDDETIDALLLLPFIHQTLEETGNDETHYLIYLANQLIGWINDGHDVYMKIKETQMSNKHHEVILKVFDEVKEDVIQYLPANKKKEITPRSKEDEQWEVYRDVIFAATQKKLLLIPKTEVNTYKHGNLLCEADIKVRSDIPEARRLAKDSLSNVGIPQTMVMSQLLVISEAITNILKHATEGKMLIYEQYPYVHIIVEDSGPGIPLKLLPNTTLLAGYSTKKSLGQGFTLMMKMAEQVLLSTNGEGTTIILKFNRQGVGEFAVNG